MHRKLHQGLFLLLKNYASLLAGWLLAFVSFRLVLVLGTWSYHGDATSSLLLKSFDVQHHLNVKIAS